MVTMGEGGRADDGNGDGEGQVIMTAGRWAMGDDDWAMTMAMNGRGQGDPDDGQGDG